MFVAHAAGVEVRERLTDRAGWQEWQRSGRWSSHPSRLTPDALATLTLPDGGEAVAFIEVDLASVTQTVLKQKVTRYLAYADDLVWQDRYPYCPPMLLFTTTATRTFSFSRMARQVLAMHRADDNDPAAALVVAACGHVRGHRARHRPTGSGAGAGGGAAPGPERGELCCPCCRCQRSRQHAPPSRPGIWSATLV